MDNRLNFYHTGNIVNEDCNESRAKKRRIINIKADIDCTVTNENNVILQMLKRNELYLTIDLTYVDKDGNTALHLLFKEHNENQIIQILHEFSNQKIDLNIENKKKQTPLHLAVVKRMRNAIALLIRYNANIYKCDNDGNLITHCFVEDEYEKFLAISNLEDSKLSLSTRNLTESESANFVGWLITNGFDFGVPNFWGWTAMHMAIERNLQHILPTILRRTSYINYIDEKKRNLLHLFLQANDKYRKKEISKVFSKFPARNKFGIWTTSFTRQYAIEIVKILLDRGISVDHCDLSGDTPLHLAIRNKENIEIVEMLIERFTNVHHRNNFGDTVFHEAIRNASSKFSSKVNYYLKIARVLLDKGADVNSGDRYGVAPVFYTVSEKKLPAIELMKKYRADFSYITKSDQNLLHLLAFKHDNDKRSDKSWETMFDLLFNENCFDINKPDKSGQSPLHIAIKHSNTIVIRKLIEKGADVNIKNDDGARPLDCVGAMTKIGDGNLVLRMLLRHGAYVNARDIHGGTALSQALSIQSNANVEELLKHGADINEPFFIDLVALHHDLDDNSAVELILRHWIKLKAANLPYSKEYDNLISVNDYQQVYRECLEEIDSLKNTFIDGSVSLYKWLHKSPNSRCVYVNNEMLKNIVGYRKLQDKFPKYHILILGTYREAIARISLMKPAIEAWYRVVKIILPEDLIEMILSYLDNADLLSLTEKA